MQKCLTHCIPKTTFSLDPKNSVIKGVWNVSKNKQESCVQQLAKNFYSSGFCQFKFSVVLLHLLWTVRIQCDFILSASCDTVLLPEIPIYIFAKYSYYILVSLSQTQISQITAEVKSHFGQCCCSFAVCSTPFI